MKANLILLLVFVFASVQVQAQGNYHTTKFTLTIKGTSNLHPWESNAKELRSNGTFTTDDSGLKSIQSLSVEIPVKSIKSSKGSIMDNKTYDALKAKNYPSITYKLEKTNSLTKKGDSYDINATGALTIAGATNKIDLSVKGKVGTDGTITFTGSKNLKMSDYKIDPPTAMFGTLTTGDEVEIIFSLTVKQ